MTAYLLLKVIHIVSSTVLFGTGLGTAFFKWTVDRSGNISAIRIVSERVVLARLALYDTGDRGATRHWGHAREPDGVFA